MHYSIDKIKLEFQYIKTDRVQGFLNRLSMSEYTVYYESNQITKCKHNFTFGDKEGVIYVGIVPNWEKEDKGDKNIVLEFNPNKVNPFLIKELSWLQTINRHCIRVMNFDIAVDMAIPYDAIRMLKRDVREYRCQIEHRHIETQYLGALGHNHIKLYDKAKEQKIKGIDWSRFEITLKEINSFSCTLKEFEKSIKIPVLYYVCSQISLAEFEQLNDSTRIILESIISDINILSTITNYRTRKKYEMLLNQYLNPITIIIPKMYDAFIKFGENFLKTGGNGLEFIDIHAIMAKQQM